MELSVFLEYGDDVSDYFMSSGVMERCPLLNNEILPKAKFISSGAQGGVYSVVLDGKKYAIKKTRNYGYFLEEITIPDESVHTLRDALQYLIRNRKKLQGVSMDTFYTVNKGDEDSKIQNSVYILARRNKDYQCKLYDELVTDVLDENTSCLISSFTYPKGSFLCENSDYVEYIIGSLCSNLLKTIISHLVLYRC